MTTPATPSATAGSSQRYAFVTLITTDTYLPGALVLAHSLRQAHSPAGKPAGSLTPADLANIGSVGLSRIGASDKKVDLVCLVTPATVSVRTVKTLVRHFDKVVGVEPLSFASLAAAKVNERGNQRDRHTNEARAARRVRADTRKKLALLGRPDLGEGAGAALTKLHAWRLTGYDKIIYLDADILVLRPLAHLFSISSALAASPDIGWPDAFNSGLMVLTPSLKTFADMREFAIQRGSWDGADQGFLNDFYGEETGLNGQGNSQSAPGGGWQRLPFRYNVTPNAGYMFAPAYQRYAAGIMTAHFIGPHKPWNRPKPSPPSRSGYDSPADHNALLYRWHEVFEECYPQVVRLNSGLADVIHSERGVEVVERPFSVPTYRAVWSLEGESSAELSGDPKRASLRARRQRAPSSSPIFRGAGQAEDLKEMFSPAIVAASAVAELETLTRDPSVRAHDGIYVSLPLDSRTSLMPAQMDSGGESDDSDQTVNRNSPNNGAIPIPNRGQRGDGSSATGEWSPPKVNWDPAQGPPPSGGGSTEYQMRNPVDTFYINAWDQPLSEQRRSRQAYGDGQLDAASKRALSRLQAEHFFDNLGSEQPDIRKVKAVFPWESSPSSGGGGNSQSSRTFPDEDPSSVVPGSRDMKVSLRAGSNFTPGTVSSPSEDTSPERLNDGSKTIPATLTYANAWDQLKTSERSSRSAGGAARPAPASGSSQPTSGHRARTSSAQAGGVGSVDVEYKRRYGGGGGGGGAPGTHDVSADQSGDGDNESSSSSDEEVERGGASWRREGPGKGYQRKAGHLQAGTSMPRSPRHGAQPLGTSPATTPGASGQPSVPQGHGHTQAYQQQQKQQHQNHQHTTSLGVPPSSYLGSSGMSRSRSSSGASNGQSQHVAIPTLGGRASPRMMLDEEEYDPSLSMPYEHLVASYDQATRRRLGMRTPPTGASFSGSANNSGASSPTLAITPVNMSPRQSRSDLSQLTRLHLQHDMPDAPSGSSRSGRRSHYRRSYM